MTEKITSHPERVKKDEAIWQALSDDLPYQILLKTLNERWTGWNPDQQRVAFGKLNRRYWKIYIHFRNS